MKKNLHSLIKTTESGFSLVQVMVAMGIAGGLAVYLMTLTENQMKSQKTIEMKAEISEIDALMRQTLRNKENCNYTFKQIAPGQTLDGIKTSNDPSVPYFAEVEKRFKNSQVSINEMYILKRSEEEDKNFNDGVTPIRAATQKAIDENTGKGFIHLRVTYSKGVNSEDKSRFLGGKTITKTYEIPGIFGTPTIVSYCTENEAAKKTECELPATFPVGGSKKWFPDPSTTPQLINQTCTDPNGGYQGNCMVYSPNAGLSECDIAP